MVTGTINGYFLIKSKCATLIDAMSSQPFLQCDESKFLSEQGLHSSSRGYLLKYWFSCGILRYQCHITIPVLLGGRLPVKQAWLIFAASRMLATKINHA